MGQGDPRQQPDPRLPRVIRQRMALRTVNNQELAIIKRALKKLYDGPLWDKEREGLKIVMKRLEMWR